MAESLPFLPAGGLADLASVSTEAGVAVDEPPADHVCVPPAEP